MFCCCNHNKQRSPHCSSFLKIKFFSPHEGFNEAFIYAATIKLTMASIQFAAPCDARKHAELIFLIQNTNDKMFIGCHEPGLGKGSVPKDPEMSGVYLFCQQGSWAPFHSSIRKDTAFLGTIEEVEAGQPEEDNKLPSCL